MKRVKMVTAEDRVRELVKLHGTARAASAATGVSEARLSAIRDGIHPHGATLDKLGLSRIAVYEKL